MANHVTRGGSLGGPLVGADQRDDRAHDAGSSEKLDVPKLRRQQSLPGVQRLVDAAQRPLTLTLNDGANSPSAGAGDEWEDWDLDLSSRFEDKGGGLPMVGTELSLAETDALPARARADAPAATPKGVLDNWKQDIAFLSSDDKGTVAGGLGGFLRSNNSERVDDPGRYLTSQRQDGFAAAAYGHEIAQPFEPALDAILGADKQRSVSFTALTPDQQESLVGIAGAVARQLLDPSDAASAFNPHRAGKEYLAASGQFARMIADEGGTRLDANKVKAITTLYINNLFLRGACSALQQATLGANGDRRLAAVAALVQRLVNDGATPHPQMTKRDDVDRAVLAAYDDRRHLVQHALRFALEEAGALPSS